MRLGQRLAKRGLGDSGGIGSRRQTGRDRRTGGAGFFSSQSKFFNREWTRINANFQVSGTGELGQARPLIFGFASIRVHSRLKVFRFCNKRCGAHPSLGGDLWEGHEKTILDLADRGASGSPLRPFQGAWGSPEVFLSAFTLLPMRICCPRFWG